MKLFVINEETSKVFCINALVLPPNFASDIDPVTGPIRNSLNDNNIFLLTGH